MKKDILDIFKDFQIKGFINKAVNQTYIALIAKKNKYEKAYDYRPISLTLTLYKLIVKVIAERSTLIQTGLKLLLSTGEFKSNTCL